MSRCSNCSCGTGTQAIGLALCGHRVTGNDLSPRAVARVAREATRQCLSLRTAAADMRRLPFADGRFDVVVCADNSLSPPADRAGCARRLGRDAPRAAPRGPAAGQHTPLRRSAARAPRFDASTSPPDRLRRRRSMDRHLPALAMARRR
ncbi:class I SAM-dependent methyltransferase [Streptomyces sp. NPDC002776]